MKAYDLAILKLKKEKEKYETYFLQKHKEKTQLENILLENERVKKAMREEIERKNEITPDIIYTLQQTESINKNEISAKIKKIEYEVLMVKKEYLTLKNKIEKIEKKKVEKTKEINDGREAKENKRIIEEAVIKRLKNRR